LTFDRINRRTHLYLALFLLPWLFMWGVTAVVFNHAPYFQSFYDDGVPNFGTLEERPFTDGRRPDETEREFAKRLKELAGLEGSYGTWRPNDHTLNVVVFDFWNARQVVHHEEEGRITIQKRRDRWDQIMTGMHARGGFEQEALLPDLWAVMVDVGMVAILLWIGTGLVMWWNLKALRKWGLVALAAGFGTFVFFIALM